MSKLGKKPIVIPKDTNVKLEGTKLVLKGPKGSRELTINDKIFTTTITDGQSLVLNPLLYIPKPHKRGCAQIQTFS